MRRLFAAWLLVLVSMLGVLGPASPAVATTPPGRTAPCGFLGSQQRPSVYRHVITIVLENHSFAEIAGRSPYLNALAAACGLADNYSAVAHPSLPNYIALTSGGTAGITDDCTACSVPGGSIFGQVGSRGWHAYLEGMPTAGYTGSEAGTYAKKHNPAAYYTRLARAYPVNAVPLGTLTTGALISDLRADRLRRYSFIAPDLCNDEHDCSVGVGDSWLARWVPKIIASRSYRSGGTALFIVYDEGTGTDNQVYSVVVTPYTARGTVSHVAFNHYSLLKTQENLLGLRCLGHACNPGTVSMRHSFGL